MYPMPLTRSTLDKLPAPLRGWFDMRSGALFVVRALDATSKRRDWKPRTYIPRCQIKRVLYSLERYLFTGKKRHLNNASQAWDRVSKATRRHQFVGAVGDLLRVTKLISGTTKLPGPTHIGNYEMGMWTRLEAAFTQVALTRETLAQIEMIVRMHDFTGGRGKGISEDVCFACGAACDIEKYVFARDLACRALDDAADDEAVATSVAHPLCR